ncbi:unnamed protein product [Pocillopora meandrina]|uniref:EGF-like domain-containing protein n=1 Tax=Pocillopora meandrina TaxID=46732 RepID=A0AAU9X321_9CNID|nr:unnamed protein product [Pocillopora meandrina]
MRKGTGSDIITTNTDRVVHISHIDECANSSIFCGVDATCVNTNGSYECTCKEGYNGTGHISIRAGKAATFKARIPTASTPAALILVSTRSIKTLKKDLG